MDVTLHEHEHREKDSSFNSVVKLTRKISDTPKYMLPVTVY